MNALAILAMLYEDIMTSNSFSYPWKSPDTGNFIFDLGYDEQESLVKFMLEDGEAENCSLSLGKNDGGNYEIKTIEYDRMGQTVAYNVADKIRSYMRINHMEKMYDTLCKEVGCIAEEIC